MGGAVPNLQVATAWRAAADVTAIMLGVPVALLDAPSRGRGPRPPKAAWTAKKAAVHICVMLSGCDYAELGRLLGLHRDTIASHCASMRGLRIDDGTGGDLLDNIEDLARRRFHLATRANLESVEADLARLDAPASKLIRHEKPSHPTIGNDHKQLMISGRNG